MKFTAETAKVYSRLITTLSSANRRGKDFNLTPEYLYNIMNQQVCAYSGEKFNNSHGNNPDAMTLERWNNDIGYIMGNVIPVKQKYNSLRSNFSVEQLEAKANQTASRIVRSSDSVKNTMKREESKSKIMSDLENTALSLKTNMENRKKHLIPYKAKQKNGTATSADLELIAALEARIRGGKSELDKVNNKLARISSSIPRKTSSAATNVDALNKIITSLHRLEKCSAIDRLKLKKGLPLTASLFQLLRGKM